MSCNVGLIIYLFLGIILGMVIQWTLEEKKKQKEDKKC